MLGCGGQPTFFLFHVFSSRLRLVGICQSHPESKANQRKPVRTEPSSCHGLPTTARPSGGRCVRGQLELSSTGPPTVCERDAVDPPPAGGVCGQPLGVQQCAPGSGLHVLLPALHLPVRTTQTSVARCLVLLARLRASHLVPVHVQAGVGGLPERKSGEGHVLWLPLLHLHRGPDQLRGLLPHQAAAHSGKG